MVCGEYSQGRVAHVIMVYVGNLKKKNSLFEKNNLYTLNAI